jgi:hypothetical protein
VRCSHWYEHTLTHQLSPPSSEAAGEKPEISNRTAKCSKLLKVATQKLWPIWSRLVACLWVCARLGWLVGHRRSVVWRWLSIWRTRLRRVAEQLAQLHTAGGSVCAANGVLVGHSSPLLLGCKAGSVATPAPAHQLTRVI